MSSSLQQDIDDLTQRHASFKQKWMDKQRSIADLLTSGIDACRTSADDSQRNKHDTLAGDITDPSDLANALLEYLTVNVPVSVTKLTQIFSRDEKEISELLGTLKRTHQITLDEDGQTVLSRVLVSVNVMWHVG